MRCMVSPSNRKGRSFFHVILNLPALEYGPDLIDTSVQPLRVSSEEEALSLTAVIGVLARPHIEDSQDRERGGHRN